MFAWFEKRLDPFPAEEPVEPPKTLIGFCLHIYARVVALHRHRRDPDVGHCADGSVDVRLPRQRRGLAVGAEPRDLLANEGLKLAGMAFIILVFLPIAVLIHSLLSQQTLMGNYPMRIRWQVHRYLLKQSMAFYQDEFAGRIATKLMQTALAVRECVIKLIEVINYVVVYFLGILFIVGSSDWRLAAPLAAWVAAYLVLLRYFIPRLGALAEQQADARSHHDRARGGQLHQHPDGKALLACEARSELRQGGHVRVSRHGLIARCGW